MVQKFIFGLMVFFLMIVLGELIFLYYISSRPKAGGEQTAAVLPTPTIIQKLPSPAEDLLTRTLYGLDSKKYDDVLITLRYSGTVGILDLKPGVTSQGFAYEAKMEFEIENGSQVGFLSNKEDLQKTQVMDGKTKKTLPLSSLKVGDKVTVEEVLDLTKGYDNNLVKETITRL